MNKPIKSTTIWVVSTTFGFFGMFGIALWCASKADNLKSQLAATEMVATGFSAHAIETQKLLVEAQKKLVQCEQTLTLLTEACSSKCNQACWSQE